MTKEKQEQLEGLLRELCAEVPHAQTVDVAASANHGFSYTIYIEPGACFIEREINKAIEAAKAHDPVQNRQNQIKQLESELAKLTETAA